MCAWARTDGFGSTTSGASGPRGPGPPWRPPEPGWPAGTPHRL